MIKKQLLQLQQDLIQFQTYVGHANEDQGGLQSEECEEIQNTINLIDDYTNSDSVEL